MSPKKLLSFYPGVAPGEHHQTWEFRRLTKSKTSTLLCPPCVWVCGVYAGGPAGERLLVQRGAGRPGDKVTVQHLRKTYPAPAPPILDGPVPPLRAHHHRVGHGWGVDTFLEAGFTQEVCPGRLEPNGKIFFSGWNLAGPVSRGQPRPATGCSPVAGTAAGRPPGRNQPKSSLRPQDL